MYLLLKFLYSDGAEIENYSSARRLLCLLKVSKGKGEVIIIDGKQAKTAEDLKTPIVSQMFRAMKDDIPDIFYVQSGALQLADNQGLKTNQIKTYQLDRKG